MSYLLPICSLNIAPATLEQCPFPSSPDSSLKEKHCQKPASHPSPLLSCSCHQSYGSSHLSRTSSFLEAESVDILPTLVFPFLCSSSQSPSSKMARHSQHHLANTQCTQMPLVQLSSLSITFFLGIGAMMFLSHVSTFTLLCPLYLKPKAFLIFCSALHGSVLKISDEIPSTPTALPFENEALPWIRTVIVSLGALIL